MSADLAERLVAILERERRASSQAVHEVHSLSVGERVEAGEAIRGLALSSRSGAGLALSCGENLSRFREGDLAWLGDGVEIAAGLAVVVRDLDPLRNLVRVDLDRFATGGRLPDAGELVLDRRELDLTERTIGAVRAIFSHRPFATARALLTGAAVPGARADPVAGPAEAAAEGLDPGQVSAFVNACSRPFHLVQGPPGSGKTRLCAAVIRAFAAGGRRVLVSAFTHRAVNNVLEALARHGSGVPVVKIGAARQADGLAELGVELAPTARRFQDAGGPVVVGVTTHAAVNLLGKSFDLVLIDEAGQVALTHACAVLPLAERHVIVGDHRQLPPLVIGQHRDQLAYRSLFEHLHAAYSSELLTRTYRMNAELCRFPSAAFYDGRLEPAAAARQRRLELPAAAGPLLAADPAVVIVPMAHRGARTLAPAEAEFAADLVTRAVAAGLPPEEVAVIAPHRAQGTRIRALLRMRLDHLEPARQPLVDTVERLQGGERDLIVLSLTASDPQAVLTEAEFFFSPNRLNVSLTRARRKLVVLMSEAILEAFPDDPAALRGADLLRRLWRECPRLAPSG